MPQYQGQHCTGACERLGHPCVRPGWFAETAAEMGAVPELHQGSVLVEDAGGGADEYPFTEWKLAIPAERQAQVIARIEAAEPSLRGDADGFLDEFPCHAGCDIIICAQCGMQHEEHLAHELASGAVYCELAEAQREDEAYQWPEPEPEPEPEEEPEEVEG